MCELTINLRCDDKGLVTTSNTRASALGISVGSQLQRFLVDIRNQRIWMQVLAEINNQDTLVYGKVYSLCILVRETRIAMECCFKQSADEKTRFIMMQGVPFDQPAYDRGDYVSEAIERKYLYDMAFLNPLENAVICTDKNGKILYFNEAATRIYGFSVDEILGQYADVCLSHESSFQYGKAIMESLREGNPWSGSFLTKHKSGKAMMCLVTDYPIFNKDGKLIGIVGVSCLQDSAASLSDVTAHATQDPFVVLKNDTSEETGGVIEWCNDSFLTLTGSNLEELTGKSLQSLPMLRPVFTEDGGEIVETPCKTHRQLEYYALPHRGISVCVFKDVTAKKNLVVSLKSAADEAETQSFKTDFITTMSHEMRTPLHAMLSEIEDLEAIVAANMSDASSPVYSRLSESFGALRYSYNLQYLLVKNVLDWQKLASGKLGLLTSTFSIHTLIQNVLRNNRFFERLRSLNVNVDTDSRIPAEIVADELKVTQILLNLVTNAEKYTEHGTTISIKCELSSDLSKPKLLIKVLDKGKGISPAMTHLLFQRFAQLHVQKPEQGGVGLGLSISQELVKMLGGEIGYEPRIGEEGSVFWFTFPFEASIRNDTLAATAPLQTDLKRPSLSNVDLGRLSPVSPISTDKSRFSPLGTLLPTRRYDNLAPVLIAEDNIINQRTLERMLIKMGFDQSTEIDIVSDGLEALQRVSARQYRLILMDMSMPNMDGITASIELRKRGYSGLIFGVTANAMDEHRESCINAGMDYFLVKPLQMDTLVRLFEAQT